MCQQCKLSYSHKAERSVLQQSGKRHQILFSIKRLIPAAISHILELCSVLLFSPHEEKVREKRGVQNQFSQVLGKWREEREREGVVDWEWKMFWFVSMGWTSPETAMGIHHKDKLYCSSIPLCFTCECVSTFLGSKDKVCTPYFILPLKTL